MTNSMDGLSQNKNEPLEAAASATSISIVVPVSERHDDIREVYQSYKAAIEPIGYSFEFIYVLDGSHPDARSDLESLRKNGERITIIQLSRWFGEAVCLSAGLSNTKGSICLTLPAYHQISADEIPKLVHALETADMAVAYRFPRADSFIKRLQSRCFNGLARFLTGTTFHDLGCGARAFKRSVADEITLYGDQYRFFPLQAGQLGFVVDEVRVKQSENESSPSVYRPGVYVRRFLDLLTAFFLIKFTKKPLRFFGLIGITIASVAFLILVFIITERLFFGIPLAQRTILFLSSLLLVLGVQLIAIGLLGELIIFTHGRRQKEYRIQEIIN